MVTKLELRHRYNNYIQAMANSNLISFGDTDPDLPTKEAIQNEDFNVDMRDTSIDGSHNLLLSYDDRRSGVRYLSPDILRIMPIELTKLLQANPSKDHEEFWWFTHDFVRAYSEEHDFYPLNLIDNFELLIRLITANPMGFSLNPKGNISQILLDSKTLASYLAYPTLEGFAKFGCRRDIKMDGTIKTGRKIRELGPRSVRNYQYSGGSRDKCSNLGMILWHYEVEVSRPSNEILIRKMRNAMGKIFGHQSDEIYNLINDFRNDSLHGRHQATQEHGVITNLICLLIWTTLTP